MENSSRGSCDSHINIVFWVFGFGALGFGAWGLDNMDITLGECAGDGVLSENVWKSLVTHADEDAD